MVPGHMRSWMNPCFSCIWWFWHPSQDFANPNSMKDLCRPSIQLIFQMYQGMTVFAKKWVSASYIKFYSDRWAHRSLELVRPVKIHPLNWCPGGSQKLFAYSTSSKFHFGPTYMTMSNFGNSKLYQNYHQTLLQTAPTILAYPHI